MGIILSLAATFAPFWQTQVFPLLPEGRMCWCSCQGPTCCREEIKGLGRIRRVRTHTSIIPLKAPLNSSPSRRMELLAQAGFVPPNMRYEFLHSFQSIRLIASSLGVCFFFFFFKFWQAVPRSKQRPLLVATKHNLMWLKRSNKLHVLLLITRGRKKKSFPFHCTSVLQLVLPCDASSVSRGVVMT